MGFDSANMTYARPFSFFADLKCSLRELKFSWLPLKPKCAHIVLGTLAHSSVPSFFCNYFIIRCRNLRGPLQDLRARDFQWLSDSFSPNICVAFRSICFCFCLLLLLHTKLFLFVVNYQRKKNSLVLKLVQPGGAVFPSLVS